MTAAANAPGGANEARNMAGRVLGRYEVLTQLASGGMAAVYIARAIGVAGFERLVAIKVLHPHLAYEEEFISMFLDEARLAARIRHPNVVPTLDISDSGGDGYFLVMEYIEGDHLGALLGRSAKQGRRLDTSLVMKIIIDALGGLGAAHSLTGDKGEPLNIVHRDVSPHNIMVGTDGISRLTDFGVAKAEVRMASTRAGQFKGKLSYMAPEQASTGEADQRSDLFSMGIILWESLTGRRLFRGENNAATLAKILNDPIPMPSSLWPDLEPFDALLEKALHRDPNLRFQTADEFMEAAEEVARLNGGIGTTRAVGALATELIGAKLDEERGRVQEAIESLGQREMGEALMPVARDGSSGSMSLPGVSGRRMITGMHSESGTGMMPVILSGQHMLPTMGTPAPQSSGGSGIKMLVVALLLVAFVGGGLLAWQVANRPSPVAQPLGPATPAPVVEATPQPATATVPDATPDATPEETPEVAEAPAASAMDTHEDGADESSSGSEGGHMRSVGRRRGSSEAAAATTTAAAEPTPPPAMEPTPPPATRPDPPPAQMGFSFGTNPYLQQ
ncbi:MAG: protein kinase [Sandaracinaceae bacterium]|nr:protein kinase [Sandaracinaceae bacterium]